MTRLWRFAKKEIATKKMMECEMQRSAV